MWLIGWKWICDVMVLLTSYHKSVICAQIIKYFSNKIEHGTETKRRMNQQWLWRCKWICGETIVPISSHFGDKLKKNNTSKDDISTKQAQQNGQNHVIKIEYWTLKLLVTFESNTADYFVCNGREYLKYVAFAFVCIKLQMCANIEQIQLSFSHFTLSMKFIIIGEEENTAQWNIDRRTRWFTCASDERGYIRGVCCIFY